MKQSEQHFRPGPAPREHPRGPTNPAFDGDDSIAPLRPGRAIYAVANQPDAQIVRMDRSELIHFIRCAELPPVGNGTMERLKDLDHDVLVRLAFLTRRCCRNQINSHNLRLGRNAPFLADL